MSPETNVYVGAFDDDITQLAAKRLHERPQVALKSPPTAELGLISTDRE